MGKRWRALFCVWLALLIASCSDGTGPTGSRSLHFTAIAVNDGSSCGLTDDGSVYCWGHNTGGLFGMDELSECSLPTVEGCSTRPRRIASPVPLTTIAMNSSFGPPIGYACGLDADGAPYCWGTIIDVDQGIALGQVPTALPGGVSLTSISTGVQHICGVAVSHEAYCWGSFEGGLRGDPLIDFDTSHATFEPNLVGGGLTFTSIAAGAIGTCGVTTGNQAYCWGSNNFGALGNPNDSLQQDCGLSASPCALTPLPVAGGYQFDSISGAGFHFCGRSPAGLLYCWGANNAEQVGNTGIFNGECCVPQPEQVLAPGVSFASVSAGGQSTCALDRNGVGYCWGASGTGQLGNGGHPAFAPTPVLGNHRFTAIAVAGDHGCGLTAAGKVFCWGNNAFGELGTGDYEHALEPVQVVEPAAD